MNDTVSRDDYRLMQDVAQEMGGIVQAVTEELGIRHDCNRDEIIARLREVLDDHAEGAS